MSEDARQAWLQRVLGLTAPQPTPDPEPPSAATPLDVMRERLARLEPEYLRILGLDPPSRTQMTATMAFAQEQLEAGDAGRAGAALDRLEKLMVPPAPERPRLPSLPVMPGSGQSLYDTVRGEGQLVAYRKALLDWEDARKQAQSEVDRLKTAIATAHPDLAGAAGLLDGVMTRLNDDLSDALDAAINAEGMAARTRTHAAAAELARAYLVRVTFDPVFRTIDRNPVAPIRTADILGTALKSLVAAIPA